jgi:zinc protease
MCTAVVVAARSTGLRALLAAVALLVPVAPAGAAPAERFTLENGLTVIVRSVDRGERIAIVTLFDVGEVHDPPGKSGLAHLVEHVYVTAGTPGREAAAAREWFARYGGQANAQTGADYTLIATVFPAADLDAEIAEAAERMGALRVGPADLEREVPRMKLELTNMYGGIPSLAAMNLARADVDPLPPEGRKGGVPAQIDTITVDEVRRALRERYRPDRATLVVVGPVETAVVRGAVERRFGDLEPGPPLPAPRPRPPARAGGVRSVTVSRAAPGVPAEGVAALAFRAPPPRDPSYPAFLTLAARLLRQEMPRFRGATGGVAPMTFAPVDDPALLVVAARVEDGQADDAAVAALRERVAAAIAIGPDDRPEPALAQMYFGLLLGLIEPPPATVAANPYTTALVLGRLHQLGIDPSALATALGAVTPDDLRRCAAEVLAPGRGAAVVVRPE